MYLSSCSAPYSLPGSMFCIKAGSWSQNGLFILCNKFVIVCKTDTKSIPPTQILCSPSKINVSCQCKGDAYLSTACPDGWISAKQDAMWMTFVLTN